MKRAVIAAVVLALAGAAAAGRLGATHETRAAIVQAQPELAWPAPGKERVYALAWSVARETSGAPGAVPLSGKLDVDVAVGTLSAARDTTSLVFAVRAVRAHEITIAGAPVVVDGKAGPALVGQQALVTIDRRGVVQSVAFRADVDAQAREVLERIVRAMQVTLPLERAASWEAVEPSPNGMARARYVVSPESERVVRRERLAYLDADGKGGGEASRDPRISGEAKITLDASGALASIEDDEVRSEAEATTRSAVTIQARGEGAFDRGRIEVAAFSDARPADGLMGFDPRAHDQRLAAGVGWDALEGQVLANEVGRPLERGFMARAGAYLRLHPEDDARVAAWFADPNASVRTRQLLVDLLSVAGDAPAQATMRDLLAAPATKKDPGAYSLYVQRFAFLERPEPESAAFVATAMRDAIARGDDKAIGGATAALGGIVRTLRRGGRAELANEHHATLVRAFAKAPPARRGDFVRALGNAGVAEDVDLLAPLAQDPDGALRDQVAYALRHMDAPRARALLLDLAADPLAAVAISAVRALGSQSLDETDWAELEDRALAGRTNVEADSTLARMIAANRASAGAHGTAILQAILARVPERNADLRATVEQFLRS